MTGETYTVRARVCALSFDLFAHFRTTLAAPGGGVVKD